MYLICNIQTTGKATMFVQTQIHTYGFIFVCENMWFILSLIYAHNYSSSMFTKLYVSLNTVF